jgi:uncharacterized protein
MLAFDRLAFDRGSIRREDLDGRLHVDLTPISKAMICPYIGREIPGCEELGLDSERIYNLFRDPAELERAAPSFNKLPLLSSHVPVDSESYAPELVVGATGERASFKSPYLYQSLVIWAQPAIDGISDNSKKELSAAYHYTPDMTPGTTADGEPYDGVMRNIIGNHVAIVVEGRSGHDVVVGDSLPKEIIEMTKPVLLSRKGAAVQGALVAHFASRLAQDAKVDFAPILKDVTAKNYESKKADIVKAVEKAVEGKLAKDASPQGLAVLLDALSLTNPAESADAGIMEPPVNAAPAPMAAPKVEADAMAPAAGAPPAAAPAAGADPAAAGGDPIAAIKQFLAGKLTPEDMATLEGMIAKCGGGGGGAAPEAKEDSPEGDPAQDEDGDSDSAEPVLDPYDTKRKANPMSGAMDTKAVRSEIAAAVKIAADQATKVQRDIRDAERFASKWVGDLAMSFDSGEQVLRHTLKLLRVEGADTVHASALHALLSMVPQPGARPKADDSDVAMDAAAVDSLNQRFGLDRITVL